ncbi:ABC transporter ATP-binding protein [Microbulbifer sp. TRSA001]|uniref:ABC transporter ATP-binding protein n=1 Tax=Microbulbifer sp. TRSA001 TaxID=3243381 RepID=UPI00403A4FB2
MQNQSGLIIEGLFKTYKNGVKALNGVNLEVGPGMYGLLGPNGAGKSSLMRTLATLQTPDSGRIMLDGVDVLAKPDFMRSKLGYLPQHIGAYPGIAARSLLERFAWLKGFTETSARRHEVDRLLEQVNLADVADRTVSTYSGGMLRRFGIAIALIGEPRLIIVDEPTAGLDPAERNRFHCVLADVAADAIVLLSTHIVEDIENVCQRLAILASGRIVVEGTAPEVTAPHKDKMWQALIPRGESLPASLHNIARPDGTQVIVHGEKPADSRFTAHTPRLEDIYHLAIEQVKDQREAA